MSFSSHIAALVALIFYIFGASFALRSIYLKKPTCHRKFLIIGAISHLFFLLNSVGFYNSFAFLSSLLSLGLFAFYLLFSGLIKFKKNREGQADSSRFEVLDAFISPIAIFFFLISSFVFHKDFQHSLTSDASGVMALEVTDASYLIELHLLLMGFALFAFTLLTVFSLALIFKSEMLKRNLLHRLSSKLPALSRIESLSAFFLNSGCVLLFLGLLSGSELMFYQFASSAESSPDNFIRSILGDPLLISSVVVFLAYTVLVFLRNLKGFRGTRAALYSCCLYLVILIPFTFVTFFQDYHVYR